MRLVLNIFLLSLLPSNVVDNCVAVYRRFRNGGVPKFRNFRSLFHSKKCLVRARVRTRGCMHALASFKVARFIYEGQAQSFDSTSYINWLVDAMNWFVIVCGSAYGMSDQARARRCLLSFLTENERAAPLPSPTVSEQPVSKPGKRSWSRFRFALSNLILKTVLRNPVGQRRWWRQGYPLILLQT